MTGPSDAKPPPDTTERVIADRYRLGPVIGRGGMATVHRARDIRLDRDVAIKLLRPEVTADPDLAQRFRREALAATVLRHPNIVACLDTGTDPERNQPYLVMDLVEGEDLSERLKRGGRLAPWQAARIGLDVARALGVAHVRGIVHRDIKPGNILLAGDGRAMVTDFGIARLAMDAEASLPGTTLGSVHYFSPEQARGATTTPASDVYGLGLVLYEALTGQRPWTGATTDAIALARVGAAAPSPRALRPEVPEALDTVVRRALAPEPGDRYPNGATLAAALEPIVAANDPSSATAVTPVPVPVPVLAPALPDQAPGAPAPVPPPAPIAPEPPLTPTPAPAVRAAPSRVVRSGRRSTPGLAVVVLMVVGVVGGAMLVAGLPGADAEGPTDGLGGVGVTQPPTPDPDPETDPPVTPSPEATPEPAVTPAPTDVPVGEVADLCERFFDVPCGLGAGTYRPSQFEPTFTMELGEGWSTALHAIDVVSLVRDEGYLTLASGVDVLDADGASLGVRDRGRDIMEAFVTNPAIAASSPVEVTIGGRRGLSSDMRPIQSSRLPLYGVTDTTYYLEADRTTRILTIDVQGQTVVMAIEPTDGSTLDEILETADVVAGSITWR